MTIQQNKYGLLSFWHWGDWLHLGLAALCLWTALNLIFPGPKGSRELQGF